jgi:hypothetical protein
LHAPARRGGIRRASKTKIKNLGTDEFASNPPFSKIYPTFHGNDGFKKNCKPEIIKKSKKKFGTLARKLFQII